METGCCVAAGKSCSRTASAAAGPWSGTCFSIAWQYNNWAVGQFRIQQTTATKASRGGASDNSPEERPKYPRGTYNNILKGCPMRAPEGRSTIARRFQRRESVCESTESRRDG